MATRKNIDSRRYLDLVLGVLAVLAAMWLSGCDGAGYDPDAGDADPGDARPGEVLPGPGLKHFPNGYPYCEIPSPTGDAPSTKAGVSARELVTAATEAGNPRFMVVDAVAARSTCAAFDPTLLGTDVITCDLAMVQSGLPVEECGVRMTSERCSDAAHDLVDSVGVRHCFKVECPAGKSPYDESSGCRATRLGIMLPGSEKSWRQHAVCGVDGSFVGWACE